MRFTVPLRSLLYVALLSGANLVSAQTLSEGARADVEALREGEMRKLVVHSEAVSTPDVSYINADGDETLLSDSDGRVRLVNFWATWCAPCRVEKPSLDALQGSIGGETFEVIAIATGRNDPEAIKTFNADVGVENLSTNLDGRSALARAMNVPGLPVTVVLNRQGEEIARLMGGADWDTESARSIVDYIVALPD